MDIGILKNVLTDETFAKANEEAKKADGKLFNLNSGEYVSTDKYAALETQLKQTQELLDNKTEEFENLKSTAGDNKALQEQIDSLKTQYESEKAEIKAQYDEQLKRNTVATAIIKEYKPKDVEDVLNHIDLKKIDIKDDKINGLSEQVETLKENKAYYFESQGATGLKHGETKTEDVTAIRKAMGLKN